ncbi:MAG: ABC-F family ATP-binding cassette domain-containing protein [Ruminococcaceae bacterium]|nr:ABC-F family ATP-binding cassette domain-containing protein [Oscillospiraceae bacterium]
MLSISVNNLCLSFGDRIILDKVSFSLEENDKLGIIGVNGSGKTSLFKLITGEYTPNDGEVYISKGKTVGVLSQYGAFSDEDGEYSDEDSALEHMFLAFPELLEAEKRLSELEALLQNAGDANHSSYTSEYSALNEKFIRDGGLEFRGRCASILSKLGFSDDDMKRAVKLLSGGQRTRLALAIQLCREPDILMLDEPTNHLDIETLAWLESFLIQYKKCVMVISHDRYFLDRVTNKTLAVENRKAKLYNGNYTKSMEQRRIDREIYEKHYKNQQKEIARQEAYIAQQRAWNRERNIIAAESRLKLLEKMDKLDAPEYSPRAIRMKFTSSVASGNDVVNIKSLSMGFGSKKLFSDLNFLVKKNDRLLIIGQNGCGKSTLIKLLMNKLSPVGGKIEYGYNVEIGYYDQENQNLNDKNTVLEELWSAYPTQTEQKIRSTLSWFNFFGEDVYKTVGMLSGGERARLTLSKLILSHMNLLILDEPTNHLDIDSREALESALEEFDGTIIAVSHDRYFIEKLATRIIEIKPQGYCDGDMFDYEITRKNQAYTEFREFTDNRRARLISESGADMKAQILTDSKEQYLRQKQNASEARKKASRIQKLQKEMVSLEEELSRTETEMQGDAATNYKKLSELDTRKNEIEERLMEIYEELEE